MFNTDVEIYQRTLFGEIPNQLSHFATLFVPVRDTQIPINFQQWKYEILLFFFGWEKIIV